METKTVDNSAALKRDIIPVDSIIKKIDKKEQL